MKREYWTVQEEKEFLIRGMREQGMSDEQIGKHEFAWGFADQDGNLKVFSSFEEAQEWRDRNYKPQSFLVRAWRLLKAWWMEIGW